MKKLAILLLLFSCTSFIHAEKIPSKWWNGTLHYIYPIPLSVREMKVGLCPWPLPDGKYIAYYRADGYYLNTKKDRGLFPKKLDPEKIIIPDSAIGASFSIINGKKEGNVLFYSRKGFLCGKGQFINDKEEGEWIMYMPGNSAKVLQRRYYKNGLLHGDYYERNPKSGVWLKGKFENDERVGEWTIRNKRGRELASVEYQKKDDGYFHLNIKTYPRIRTVNKVFLESEQFYAHSNRKDTLTFNVSEEMQTLLDNISVNRDFDYYSKLTDEQIWNKTLKDINKSLKYDLSDYNKVLIHESFNTVYCTDTFTPLHILMEYTGPKKTRFKTKKGELYTLLEYTSWQGHSARPYGVEELINVLSKSPEEHNFFEATKSNNQKIILNNRGDTVYQLLDHTIKNLEEVGIGMVIEKNALKTPMAIDTHYVAKNQFLDRFISNKPNSNTKRKTRNFLAHSKFNGKPMLCTEYWFGHDFKILIEWEKREELKHGYIKYFGEIQRNELHKNICSGNFHPQFSYFYKSEPYNGRLEFKKGAEEKILCESNSITIQSRLDLDFCVAEGEVLDGKKTGIWKFHSKHDFSDVECVSEFPFQNGKINGSGKILALSERFSGIMSNFTCSGESFKPFVMSTLAFKNDYPRGQWYAMSKDNNILIEGAFDEKGKQGEFNIYDHLGEKLYSAHYENNEARGASLIKIPNSEINIKYRIAKSSYTRGVCQLNYQNGNLQGYQKIVLDKKILEFFPNTDSTIAKICFSDTVNRVSWFISLDTLSKKNRTELPAFKKSSSNPATVEEKLRLLVEEKLNFIISSVHLQTSNSTNYENWDNPEAFYFSGSFEVFKNGNKLLEGKKRDGEPSGTWTIYDDFGAKKIEVDYSTIKNTGMVGPTNRPINLYKMSLFFPNGNIMAEGFGFNSINWSTYTCNNRDINTISFNKVWNKNGELVLDNGEGKFTVYYPNGITMLEGEYKGGKREGVWFYYTENGHLTKIIPYTNGEKDGLVLKGNLSGVGEQIKQCGPEEYYSAFENEILEKNISFMWELYDKGNYINEDHCINLKARIIFISWNDYLCGRPGLYQESEEYFHVAAEEDFIQPEN